jgi:hypothetical protein
MEGVMPFVAGLGVVEEREEEEEVEMEGCT